MKKKTKKIPENELPLRMANAAAGILRLIDERLATLELTKEWQDELIDKVAQCLCRRDAIRTVRMLQKNSIASGRRVSWKNLDGEVKGFYRQSARAALKTVARFVEKKRRASC